MLWSIRESELLASSVGIDVPTTKLIAFIVAALFAGVAGSFYANYVGYISPLIFDFQYSVSILIFIVVGGLTSLAGPVVGAVVRLTLVPEMFRVTGKYQLLGFGLILLLSMRLMPQGIIGTYAAIRARRAHRALPKSALSLGIDSEV